MNKATRAAGAVVLGAAAVAVLAAPAAAAQDGPHDCQWGKVCTWSEPEFHGDLTMGDADGECHSGDFLSALNRSQARVIVFMDDDCQARRDTLYPGDIRPFVPGRSWLAVY